MIEPDAKCVVNGSKLNEAIMAFNPLLAMNVSLGDVVEPSVKYSEGGVQITLPSPFEYANEELDVVNSDNTAGTRWFLTSTSQGGASSSLDSSTTTTSNTPINKSNQSRPKRNRDELHREGGGQNNRDQLNRATGGGGALRDDGTTTRTGPQPSGALRDDGTTTRTGPQPSGALRDDGTTTRTGGDLTPKPGAPPITGNKPKQPPSRRSETSLSQDLQNLVNQGQFLPMKNGAVDVGAIENNIKNGTASDSQKEFYNKAMGLDTGDEEDADQLQELPQERDLSRPNSKTRKSVQNYGRPQPGLFQDSFSKNKMTARRPDAKYAPKKQKTMKERYEQDKGVRRATRYARNEEGRAQAKEDYKKRYSGQPPKVHPGLYGS